MNSLVKKQTKTMKECLYDTLHHHDTLSIEAIAEELDMTKSYLYRTALPDMDMDGEKATGVRFPLKQLVPLVRVTGDYQVLDQLEWSLGRVAITIPRHDKRSVSDTQKTALDATVRFGNLIKEIQQSLDDGVINSAEQQRIDKAGRKLIQEVVSLLSVQEDR